MLAFEGKVFSCKLVILGNSGVGKTSILHRWATGHWDGSLNTTIGARHQRKRIRIQNNDVDLFLWDTAGQEQYQALTPYYIRSASIALVVTSVTDQVSFSSIDYWLTMLRESCEIYPPVVLVVNKMDLLNEQELSREQILRNYGSLFRNVFFVSAQSGDQVDELFRYSSEEAFAFTRQYLGQDIKSGVQETRKPDNTSVCC